MDPGGLETRIRSSAAELERKLAPIEQVFLEAGNQLAGAVEVLGRLTEGFQAMAGQLDDPRCLDALGKLEDVSRRLGQLGGSSEVSQGHMAALQGGAARLGSRLGRLRKTIGEVKVLAINAKVEAAHVTAANVDFSVFTREIGRLADLANEGLDRLGGELGGLLDGMGKAAADLDSFNRDHRQALGVVGGRLAAGLDAVSRRRHDSAEAVRGMEQVSRRMGGEIAQAVEALQVGDITRQRAEHVREALATLLDVLAGEAVPGGGELPPEHRPVLVATVCQLQGAQAGHTAADLERELGRIAASLHGLAGDADELPRRCAAAYGGGDARSSFLSELGRELAEADQLLRRYSQARAGVDALVAGISQVAAGMVHHIEAIRSIEADMRVMGLNATFKCARLGNQGRALSVIAQELRGYSNKTAEDSRAIMADLEQLIAAARDMDTAERDGLAAAAIEADMSASVAALEEVGEGVGRVLAALSGAGAQVTQALERSCRQIEAHPEFASALARCRDELEAVAAEAGEGSGDIDCIRAEVLDLLRGRYTMASERKVHEMFGGPAEPETSSDEAAIDDLFF